MNKVKREIKEHPERFDAQDAPPFNGASAEYNKEMDELKLARDKRLIETNASQT